MTARLDKEGVAKRAAGFGFVLVSPYEDYASNESVLQWRCKKAPLHLVEMTLGHMSRGCPECRRASRDSERRFAEFAKVASALLERGDLPLSGPGDYVNQNSQALYVCCLCGEEASQTAKKIRMGKRHECQRMAAAHGKRKREAYDAVVKKLQAGGIELLTSVQEYGGLRSRVKYKLMDAGAVAEEATVLRLERMAQRRRACSGVDEAGKSAA